MASLMQSLKEVAQLPGAIRAALVDIEMGVCLGIVGGNPASFCDEMATYANTMRWKDSIVNRFHKPEEMEEIVFNLKDEFHFLYPMTVRILNGEEEERLFFFIAMRKSDVTLLQARAQIANVLNGLNL